MRPFVPRSHLLFWLARERLLLLLPEGQLVLLLQNLSKQPVFAPQAHSVPQALTVLRAQQPQQVWKRKPEEPPEFQGLPQ
jgi:hypothetical protein